ncbi:MAG: 2-oxo acid dehydrogenase subunit E2 [Deltaproteobacteria bacterium]|nr:2-oxo acid dehydrogenase subunit E2 [Deltaproteobacteria bacterium]
MEIYLTMPKPGETIREGLIIQWLKHEGEEVFEKDPLVELETEKAVFTYESPFHGKLKKILVSAEESQAIGTPIALFEVSEEEGARYRLLGVGVPVDTSVREEAVPLASKEKPLLSSNIPSQKRNSYSPLIRHLAQEHHLTIEELDRVPRKDLEGRLTKEEVLNYLKNKKSNPKVSEEKDVLLSPIRQRIAQRMMKSAQEIPHAASSVDVDFTEIENFKKTSSQKIKTFSFFVYAIRESLKKFPQFNSSWIEKENKFYRRPFSEMHFAIAVATDRGLMNPVLHQVESMSFFEMIEGLERLEFKAREGNLSVEDSTGGTFAVNNPGAFGGSRCFQIIPFPMSAIIGLNRISDRPWIWQGDLTSRKIAAIDFSFDHRLYDGAEAIQFLEQVKNILEQFPFERVSS